MNLAKLTNLLENVRFLKVDGEYLSEPRINGNMDKPHLFSMSLTELSAIDPRLPAAVEGQLAITKEITNGKSEYTVYGQLLRRTLLIWQGEQMIQTVEAGAFAYEVFWEFDKVKLSKKTAQMRLTLYGSRIQDFTSKEGVSIQLSGRTLKETFTVCPVWLQDNYPGWEQRYVVASTLGYEGQELVIYTLPQAVEKLIAPAEIESVKFY